MKFNTFKRLFTTAATSATTATTSSCGLSSPNVVGGHVRLALENLKHDGQLSTLISTLNSDANHLLDLGFSDIQLIANQYRKLYKSQQIPHDVNEKMASLMLDYFTRHGNASLQVPQCLELFDVSCQTRLDKQTGLLAWHIYSVAKDKCVGVPPREWLELVMNVLKRLTRYNILYPEMLDFVSQHLAHLDKDLLVDFASIAQRNGLRSKHHLDAACRASLQLVSQYDFATLLRLLGCFCYFSHEYKDLFKVARPILLENVSKLSQDDILMVLNICKTLHKEPDFLQLRDAILQELTNNFETCTLQFLVATLPHLTRGTRTFIGGQYISKVLDVCESEFEECNVQKLASIMACIEFWNIRMSHLTSILDVLASRIKQIAYNRNLGLWSEIFNVIYSTGWFHVDFMKAASNNIIMEPQVLHRVSTHQIVRVLQTYYKIRYFHKGAYQAMIDAIDGDFESIANRPNVVAEALLAAADAYMPCESLAQKSLDVLSKTAQIEATPDKDIVSTLEGSNFWPRNIITSAWSLTVYDLHKDPKFVPLLKLIGLDAMANFDSHQPSLVLMALEVAEACIIDGIEVDFCRELMDVYGAVMRRQQQALDNIEKQRQQQLMYGADVDEAAETNVESTSAEKASFSSNQNSHFHKGRMRATRHIYDILNNMRRRDVLLRVAPHYNSPFVIDICFSSEDRRGIVLFSGRELLRNHQDGKWSIVETGSTHLKRKILSSSGWTLFEISCAEWAKLTNTNERRQYIKDALVRLGM